MTTELQKTQLVAPRVARNRTELDKFLAANNIKSQWPAVDNQIESVVIRNLPDSAYNPSIIRFNGKLLLSYRFHETTLKTKLGIAELDEKFTVLSTQVLDMDEDASAEDGRLFQYGDGLYMMFTVSHFPSFPASQMKIAKLSKPDKWRISDKLDYWLPDRQTTEKNHLPLIHDGALNIIYHHNLKQDDGLNQIVLTPSIKREMKTPALRWPWGEIRGGTPPIAFKGAGGTPFCDRLISFFHSSLTNEMPPTTHRYCIGCVILKAEPPFQMLQVSKRPILRGSEIGGDEGRFHFKKNVVFAAGAIECDGGWMISVGVNDCQSLMVKITEKDLNL